jgi:predicted nucleic acid-binding protein
MNVLVDSSVWAGHFKQRNTHLASLLEDGLVVCHPYVVAEIACGTPPKRRAIVDMLTELECTPVATQEEFLAVLDAKKLYGRGCGYVDISLLASTLLSENTRIWTTDKRLALIATELNLAYSRPLHS